MKLKESQTVEFKESIGQLSRAMASLCAFANTDLGTIYFGIDDGGNSRGMTIEKLHQPHKSVLRNGTLGELLFLAKYIEKWGTGIQNIKDWMTLNGLPEPKYEMMGSNLVTILFRQVVRAHRHHVGTKLGLSWD